MGYNNIVNLIHTLINNHYTPHIEIDESTLDDNLEEVLKQSSVAASNRNFWLNFLSFLNSEDSKINMPLRQSDLENTRSLGEFVNNFADLLKDNNNNTDDIFEHIQDILDRSKTLSENDGLLFWNYSVNTLIYKTLEAYKNAQNLNNGVIIWNDEEYPIIEISTADAGAAFNYDFTIDDITDELVIPWENWDGESFKDVMHSEFCVSLNNSKKTQFTRMKEENDEWIRLLMPQNNKRVEVIDLDRNFWVISNVLGRICMYLFGDDSSLFNLFKDTLNEIIQLWENVLYLWISLAMYCNTASSNIHIEFCTVPPSQQSHDRQYDYAENADTLVVSNIKDKLQYLIDKYPKRILVVIPFIRSSFIGENKYRTLTIPYVFWHFPFDDSYSYSNLYFEKGQTTIKRRLKISTAYKKDDSESILGLKDYLVGYRKQGNTYIKSNCSLSKLQDYYGRFVYRYNSVARIVPSINLFINGQDLRIADLTFEAFDIIREDTQHSYKVLELNPQSNKLSNGDNITFSYTYSNMPPTSSISFTETTYQVPFYIGEVLSTYGNNKKVSYDVMKSTVQLKPLGVDELREIPSIGQLIKKDTNILNTYANEHGSGQPDIQGKLYFRLFIGNHISGIHYGGDDLSGTYSWYEIDGNDNTKTKQIKDILYVNKTDRANVINKDAYDRIHLPDIKKNYELGNHSIGKIGLCASLYNPIIRSAVINYPKYNYQSEHGNVGFPTYCEEKYTPNSEGYSYNEYHVVTFWTDSQLFTYRRLGDNEYTENNWFIRYVQISGAYVLEYKASEASYTKSTVNTAESCFRFLHRNHNNMVRNNQTIDWKDATRSVKFFYNNKKANGEPYDSNRPTGDYNETLTLPYKFIVYKVTISLFGPNGEYETATYRRREGLQSMGTTSFRFLGTGDELSDWELGEETSKGFGQLRKKLSEQYVLQLNEGAYSLYGTKTMPDFEASKRCGLVKTSKNDTTLDIEPIDTMPWDI